MSVASAAEPRTFRVWAYGDAHVGTDHNKKRESLAEAFRHSERDFAWDIAIDVGDNSGNQGLPNDQEGNLLVEQFATLTQHRREQIYSICGNHDRSGLKEPEAWWFQKWVDPLGQDTRHSRIDPNRRPYPIDGTWERYSFRVGNLLFLMMSDINEPSQKVGRGDLGGNPGGVVRQETFAWWQRQVAANRDAIIISAHHYMLKDTTTASGEWEGLLKDERGNWRDGYHGYKPDGGAPNGASYLYWVNSVPDAQAFETHLAANPSCIALWLGGHTHPCNPDDTAGGKPLIASKWGVHFANVCALSQHHHGSAFTTTPLSRLFTFTEGSDEVRVQCYLHTSNFAPQGWYDKAERKLKLPRPFVYPDKTP